MLLFFSGTIHAAPYSIAVQGDGKILVGGEFTIIGGQARNNIARLNADGAADTTFNSGAGPNDGIASIAVQANGKILVGGYFSSIGGQARSYIVRLNAGGTVDTNFNPDAAYHVHSIAVQADGKILVGGKFETIGGQARNYIARLNADGMADTNFNPDALNIVETIVVQADGKILVGGFFTIIGGQARYNLARLNSDGTADTTFDPDANGKHKGIAPILLLLLNKIK
ncbi:MAG: delta-60 repeat domain-containing protein [Desulfocapsaceae bacterium]|nr:delta-60 repeat domain-containing protein [Desulfocapsaceae bacterium]